MDQSNLRNGTEEICGDQIQCRFDFEVTGIESIAKSTKEFVSKFDSLRRDIQPGLYMDRNHICLKYDVESVYISVTHDDELIQTVMLTPS